MCIPSQFNFLEFGDDISGIIVPCDMIGNDPMLRLILRIECPDLRAIVMDCILHSSTQKTTEICIFRLHSTFRPVSISSHARGNNNVRLCPRSKIIAQSMEQNRHENQLKRVILRRRLIDLE